MKKQLVACAQEGDGAIAVSKDETRLNAAFLADVNKELNGKGQVTLLSEPLNIRGGFVYISEGLEINVSLDSQLNEAWQDVETQVAAVLFES